MILSFCIHVRQIDTLGKPCGLEDASSKILEVWNMIGMSLGVCEAKIWPEPWLSSGMSCGVWRGREGKVK